MDREHLNKLLAQVHSELRNAESMDADQRKALQQTADDLKQALDRGDDGASVNQLAARLKLNLTQIEANHPSLTLSISELVDALSNIGV
jgi:hypothetical protein